MADELKLGFTDPRMLALYRHVVEKIGSDALKAYDRAYPTIDYQKTAPGPATPGPDQILQFHELIQATISDPRLKGEFRWFSGRPFPWEASSNAFNRKLFAQFDGMVQDWRKNNPDKDRRGEDLARVIFDWVRRPQGEGGLGLSHLHGHPELTFDEAVRSKEGDCTEIYYILKNLYRRAGYSVSPHLVRVDRNGKMVIHIVAGVRVDGKTCLVDPIYGEFNAPHQRHVAMTPLQLLSVYWSNWGSVAAQRRRDREALASYNLAILIDPYNAVAHLNRAAHFTAYGPAKAKEARAALAGLEKLAPDWNLYLSQMGLFLDGAGNFLGAVEYFKKSLRNEPRETDTRIHLVQAMACAGDLRGAREELKALYDSYGERWTPEQGREYQRLEAWLDHRIKSGTCGKSKETPSRAPSDK